MRNRHGRRRAGRSGGNPRLSRLRQRLQGRCTFLSKMRYLICPASGRANGIDRAGCCDAGTGSASIDCGVGANRSLPALRSPGQGRRPLLRQMRHDDRTRIDHRRRGVGARHASAGAGTGGGNRLASRAHARRGHCGSRAAGSPNPANPANPANTSSRAAGSSRHTSTIKKTAAGGGDWRCHRRAGSDCRWRLLRSAQARERRRGDTCRGDSGHPSGRCFHAGNASGRRIAGGKPRAGAGCAASRRRRSRAGSAGPGRHSAPGASPGCGRGRNSCASACKEAAGAGRAEAGSGALAETCAET